MSERELQLNQMYRRLKFVLETLRDANQTLQANHTKDTCIDDTKQISTKNDTNKGVQSHG